MGSIFKPALTFLNCGLEGGTSGCWMQCCYFVRLTHSACSVQAQYAHLAASTASPAISYKASNTCFRQTCTFVTLHSAFSNNQGAILKRVDGGAPNETPFKMLKREKDDFIQVGSALSSDPKLPDSQPVYPNPTCHAFFRTAFPASVSNWITHHVLLACCQCPSQIGQSLKRPDNDDLEATFINASAAKSPLTKAARAVRGLFQRK